jgi:hypothetical protein
LEQTDIVPVLQSFKFVKTPGTKKWGTKDGELAVENPPTFSAVTLGELQQQIDEEDS